MTMTAQRPVDAVPLGVAMMIGFCAIAPLIDVCAKLASQHVTITQVTFLRLIVQTLLMAPVVLAMRQSLRLTRSQLGLLALRALMLIGSTYAFVGAVQVMPIADALAIAFVEPFILLALGFLLFGDQVGPRRIGAAVIGFLGALMVIQPNFERFGAVALYPVATAVFFALYMLLTRRISREVAPEAMQFHTAALGTAILVPVLAWGAWAEVPLLALTNPAPEVWLQLFGVGLAATVSHLSITYALRFAPSATLAPLHYLEIVNAVFFGWLFFGDWPNLLSWAGIAVIVGSGLYIIARERRLAREARAAGPRSAHPTA
jgi:drug/metabolite transporter (DMT)-like permease